MIRQAAWHVLRSGAGNPTRTVDAFARKFELDERDRGLLRRIVATEIRRRGTLRALVRTFTRKVPKPELVAHLHIGIVQLFFLDRVPDHAAVSETCDAVARTVGASKVAFVNGVLRNLIRARREGVSGDKRRDIVDRDLHLDRAVFRDPVYHPLLWAEDALSVPAALMKRWIRRYRVEPAERLARFFLSEPPLVLRAFDAREALVDELTTSGVRARVGRRPATIVCTGIRADSDAEDEEASDDPTAVVTSSAAFREGRLTIQGETAGLAAELLEARSGERLLDLCAAPGGKTAVLAREGADVVAVDRDPVRIERAVSTLRRLGLQERVKWVASDGLRALGDEAMFDGVLIDAPCSNTGVMGARAEARWRFGPKSSRWLEGLQQRLLNEGATRVRPGGRLVWSTCSLEPEENGRLVRRFLTEAMGWELEHEQESLPDAEHGPWDGGYAARLRRRPDA